MERLRASVSLRMGVAGLVLTSQGLWCELKNGRGASICGEHGIKWWRICKIKHEDSFGWADISSEWFNQGTYMHPISLQKVESLEIWGIYC